MTARAIDRLLADHGDDIALVIHAAAQPSHDWAAREPFTDFDVNAVGTLNMLEATRQHAPDASFIFCSTNKVYGDRPNSLPLIEEETRFELRADHPYYDGIKEDMSVDSCLHSLFGASKLAADVMVQEYGRYFDMKTAVFRGGTLTGPAHSATELHGFLGYVMRCAITGTPYTIFGYKGKQVRDAIHSHDLIRAFEAVLEGPAGRRGLQHRRRPDQQRLGARGDRDVRGDHRQRGLPQLRGEEPDRRSPLVDRQQSALPRPLPELGRRVQRRAHPRRDLRAWKPALVGAIGRGERDVPFKPSEPPGC